MLRKNDMTEKKMSEHRSSLIVILVSLLVNYSFSTVDKDRQSLNKCILIKSQKYFRHLL